jgi:hypothetical protein
MKKAQEELSGMTVSMLVLAFVGLSALGWISAGPLGALFGGGFAAVAGVIGVSWGRLRRAQRMLDDHALPDMTPLPPQQALAMMTAMSGAEDGLVSYRSELLARLEEIRALAARDPRQALVLAEELSEDHPRNPAARAVVARTRLALGDHEAGMSAGNEAIVLALDGGMNPAAAALFEELSEHRDDLELEPRHFELLARILENRQDVGGAAWCRTRVDQRTSERER